MELKYLFTSLMQSGEYIIQDQSDSSVVVPGRNRFFDVLEEIKNNNHVLMFCLVNQESREENRQIINDSYLVDLRTGEFVINGAKFFLHDLNEKLNNFRLIFYKTRKEHFIGSANVGSETIYHLGWQANNEAGKNIQCKIDII